LLECLADLNPPTTVSDFPRFNDPDISKFFYFLLDQWILPQLLLLLYILNPFIEVLQEFLKLLVFCPLLYMEGQGDIFEGVILKCFIIAPHVIKKSLFVAQVPLVLEMIVHLFAVTFIHNFYCSFLQKLSCFVKVLSLVFWIDFNKGPEIPNVENFF